MWRPREEFLCWTTSSCLETSCSKQTGDCGDLEVGFGLNGSGRLNRPPELPWTNTSDNHDTRDTAETRTTYLLSSGSSQTFQCDFCLSFSSELWAGSPPAGTRPVEDEAGRHVAGCSGPDLKVNLSGLQEVRKTTSCPGWLWPWDEQTECAMVSWHHRQSGSGPTSTTSQF